MEGVEVLEDLLIEILSRSPVKVLLRLWCVCKHWLRIISDPSFVEQHRTLSLTRSGANSLPRHPVAAERRPLLRRIPLYFSSLRVYKGNHVPEWTQPKICNLSTKEIIPLPSNLKEFKGVTGPRNHSPATLLSRIRPAWVPGKFAFSSWIGFAVARLTLWDPIIEGCDSGTWQLRLPRTHMNYVLCYSNSHGI